MSDVVNNSDKLYNNLNKLLVSYQEVYFEFTKRMQNYDNDNFSLFRDIVKTFQNNLIEKPDLLLDFQMNLGKNFLKLSDYFNSRLLGCEVEEPFKETPGDKRFQHEAWSQNLIFNSIKEFYLMLSETTNRFFESADFSDSDRFQMQFITKQYLDSISPTNCPFLNPEVLTKTMETSGENLIKGLENFLNDLRESKDFLQVSSADKKAFQVGKDIACTEGQVVYRNELIELIYYKPKTENNYEIPMLIIPPWFNKYYIFDLRPETSFISWMLERNYSVFIISWKNPDASYANFGFENYVEKGIVDSVTQIQNITKQEKVNTLGYCIGGIGLACAVAYLKARNKDIINSSVYFTTMLDFIDIGALKLFIDENYLKEINKKINKDGYYDGCYISQTFNILRANEMIWQFVINNYYLGKEPLKFDLLYWNADSTRMPGKMQKEFLEEFLLKNKLAQPNGIKLNGTPIDLTKIDVDSYFLSAKDDHIVPWKTSFLNLKHFKGKMEFVLAGSGHVAGIFNHPNKNKYCYWQASNDGCSDADEWFKKASQHAGSWWNHMDEWLQDRSGSLKPAMSCNKMQNLGKAPGKYVLE